MAFTICPFHKSMFAMDHGCRYCWIDQQGEPIHGSLQDLVNEVMEKIEVPNWARSNPRIEFAISMDDGWVLGLSVLWWTGEKYKGGEYNNLTYYVCKGVKLSHQVVPDVLYLRVEGFQEIEGSYGLWDPPQGNDPHGAPEWVAPAGKVRMDAFASMHTGKTITDWGDKEVELEENEEFSEDALPAEYAEDDFEWLDDEDE